MDCDSNIQPPKVSFEDDENEEDGTIVQEEIEDELQEFSE